MLLTCVGVGAGCCACSALLQAIEAKTACASDAGMCMHAGRLYAVAVLKMLR